MKKYILTTALAALFIPSAFAQMAGWSNMTPITVSNTASTAITGYQLKINLNTQALVTASQMQASGNDIRFGKTCDGAVQYNYWIESGMNSASTNIWVKVDSIPANGTRTFFMFYGNASATSVSSIPSVFIGPVSATDSLTGGSSGGVPNSQRGFHFAPNEDILVTSFGKREPNGTTRYVTLFDYSTQAILSQSQVGGPAAQYSYGSLSNPLWLTQGTQYVLELFQGAADGYYLNFTSQINPHLTYYNMLYCNSCTQNTFPTNSLGGAHYGFPDLLFYIKNNVSPAPTYSLNQGPLLTVAQSATAVCASSSSVTFTVSSGISGMTYTWLPSGANGGTYSAWPSASTSYTVTGQIPGCTLGAISGVVSVNVYQTPTVSVSGNSLICGSGSCTLTASGASTYTWSTGDATASAVVTPTATGTYTVAGTDSNGCTGTAVSTVTVAPLPPVMISGPSTVCQGHAASLTASGASTYTWSTGANTTSVSVSPTAATVYTLSGTDANGCVNTYTQSMSINPLPTIIASSSTTQVCAGTTAVLSASGATTYSWNTGATTMSVVVSPVVTTVYTVTGTGSNGCSNTATVPLTVHPAPIMNATSSSNSICVGGTATLTATGASTYSWSTSQTSASIIVSPTVSTTYSVNGTDANGCKAFTTITQGVQVCAGIDELTAGKEIIAVYPNPNNGQFVLETAARTQVTIYNLLGAVVLEQTVEGGKHPVSITDQANGIYYIRARQNNYQQVLKVIRQ